MRAYPPPVLSHPGESGGDGGGSEGGGIAGGNGGGSEGGGIAGGNGGGLGGAGGAQQSSKAARFNILVP